MLASAKLVGFILCTDYDRAREFYEGGLGAEFVSQDQFALVVRVGSNQIRIVRVPEHQALRATVLGWEVEDIDTVVGWLKGRGIEFDRYPFMKGPDPDIWNAPGGAKVAWFKDPDGNVLSISQHLA